MLLAAQRAVLPRNVERVPVLVLVARFRPAREVAIGLPSRLHYTVDQFVQASDDFVEHFLGIVRP